jgi:hypothetical protein
MKTKMGLAVGTLVLIALSVAYADVLPPALAPAPVNPFPPTAPVYAPAAPCPAAPDCPPQRKKLFNGRLRERIKTLFHWGCCP